MKFYKSEDGEVFAYEEDGSQDDFIRPDLTLLSAEELAGIRAAQEAERAPTPDDLRASANVRRDGLMIMAGIRIAPLQDAFDLGDATVEDVANLKLWKQYRTDVNRVSGQPGFPSEIIWPDQPSQ